MNCKDCKKAMIEEEKEPVPFWEHQQSEARAAHREKWLFSIIILLIVLLVGSNFAWIYYESQFETVTTTEHYEVDSGGGGNAIINGEGSVSVNGESENNQDHYNPET